TARLPQAEGMMPGVHFDLGGNWMGMVHGYAWGAYTDQGGPRGDDKVFVQSMAMLMAEGRFDGGRLQLRAMMSAEPLMSDRGYPVLFATGETAGGEPLVDRQHPHDLFMELAARVDVDVAEGATAFLYGGPVGEPALGPPAFMHRASARANPEPPITHHWFDSTHVTFGVVTAAGGPALGRPALRHRASARVTPEPPLTHHWFDSTHVTCGVVTAGVATGLWQLEASAFRGGEPDKDRWDIETPRLDSWSVRATLTPSPNWAAQVSYGRIEEPEALHPEQDEGR